MRTLMYLALGFGIACGGCAYCTGAAVYGSAAAAVLLLCMIGKKHLFVRRLVLAALGCLLGFFWFSRFHSLYLKPVEGLDQQVVSLSIRSSDFGEAWRGDTFFDGTVELEGNTYRIQTRLKDDVDVEPGMVFSGRFYLRVMPTGIDPGEGIFLAAYQEDTITQGWAQPEWYDAIARFRRDIKGILQQTFPEDTRPFARALLLGDTSEISYEIDTAMKISGIRHVVAVSGLHISILFGLLSTITFRKRFLMALVGYPLLFFFAALTGFTPSVMRSCLMWALILLAKLTDREYDGPTSLGFAVLVMLILDPLMIRDVGFQLSVASVAGIFLFRDPVFVWLRGFLGNGFGSRGMLLLIKWLCNSISITLSAMTLTVPLCAYYFGTVSLVGVVTNLLALWVVCGIFYGIMAVCLLYWTIPAAGAVVAGIVSWPIRYVLWVAKTMAAFPLAAVYTASPYITAWLVFVYVLLAVFLLGRNRRPWIFACCMLLGLCAALSAQWMEASAEDVRITVLDVGQGQSILLQSEGRSVLVDCGGDSDTSAADRAAEELLSQGISKLDGLILTHLDRDHAGGAKNLLSRIETELLILPRMYTDLNEYTAAEVICAAEPLEIRFGEETITLYPATFPGKDNEKSLCVLFDTKKCDILITGDRDDYGERSLLRNFDIPDVDVLVAGHHGAASSTCEELLAAEKPEIVCISAGEGNPYGHPAPALLQRLESFGCDIYRTDIQGTITIRR